MLSLYLNKTNALDLKKKKKTKKQKKKKVTVVRATNHLPYTSGD